MPFEKLDFIFLKRKPQLGESIDGGFPKLVLVRTKETNRKLHKENVFASIGVTMHRERQFFVLRRNRLTLGTRVWKVQLVSLVCARRLQVVRSSLGVEPTNHRNQ